MGEVCGRREDWGVKPQDAFGEGFRFRGEGFGGGGTEHNDCGRAVGASFGEPVGVGHEGEGIWPEWLWSVKRV